MTTAAKDGPNPAYDLLVHARAYLRRGLSVIPTRGKVPTILSWKPYTETRATDAEIERWFTADDADGLAVICGRVSDNLVCRDFDDPESYERWTVEQANLADLFPTVETGRGWHVYLTADIESLRRRCGARCYKVLEDGELRFDGAYCLLPPSIHPSGRRYEWRIPLPEGEIPLADPFAIGLVPMSLSPIRVDHSLDSESSRRTESTEMASVVSVRAPRLSVDEVITRTLPSGRGHRNLCLLDLARGLKFHTDAADRTLLELKPIVRRWFHLALPVIETGDFDTTWFDFTHAFERARLPLGDLAAMAFDHARHRPLPALAAGYDDERVQLLVATCAQLQEMAGDHDFSLSISQAATLLWGRCENDVDWRNRRSRAHRILRGLERDGVLLCTERAKPGPAGGRASRYRYGPETRP